jgi:carbamoyltransferase
LNQNAKILGISAFYHDSAASLLVDGRLVAAAQEERFTREKHDSAFPSESIRYCLREAGLSLDEIDYVVFYDKPLLKFERLIETYLHNAPRGRASFLRAIPVWLKEKLFLKRIIRQSLAEISETAKPKLLFNEHHQSHAASAFFPSPFEKAAVLCLDGVGEWATSSVWLGEGRELKPLWQINFPHSLGLLYSAFTYYTGFKVNSGEYKLMGLAPYGRPIYTDLIRQIIDIKEDGTYRLDMRYFDFATDLKMTNSRFSKLFGGPPRKPESPLTQREMDLAASVQKITEEVVLKLARTIRRETGAENLCLAGGVALNCVANGLLRREKIFDNIWVQPAAGDAGGALGAAYSAWHGYLEQPRIAGSDQMQGAFLGPSFTSENAATELKSAGAIFRAYEENELYPLVAKLLAEGNVVGWVQGRMEFGPRALGSRSILGDPRNPAMQETMNLKIKFRESFRPFAPAVKKERVEEYFDFSGDAPYMQFTAPVSESQRKAVAETGEGLARLKLARSTIPAVTHLDFSARLQTVDSARNPRFHRLLSEFENQTGCPVLVNTSFNVRGEPIVCTPADAYRCFLHTEMEYLVVENLVMKRSEQPVKSARREIALD